MVGSFIIGAPKIFTSSMPHPNPSTPAHNPAVGSTPQPPPATVHPQYQTVPSHSSPVPPPPPTRSTPPPAPRCAPAPCDECFPCPPPYNRPVPCGSPRSPSSPPAESIHPATS